jgi:hypothetical protein
MIQQTFDFIVVMVMVILICYAIYFIIAHGIPFS